ncbi:MAG: PAS domain S-box protein [Inhella sp.]
MTVASPNEPGLTAPALRRVIRTGLLSLLAGLALTAVCLFGLYELERRAELQRLQRQAEWIEQDLQRRLNPLQQLMVMARVLVQQPQADGLHPDLQLLSEGQPLQRQVPGLEELRWVERVAGESEQWLQRSGLPVRTERRDQPLPLSPALRTLLERSSAGGQLFLALDPQAVPTRLWAALPVYRSGSEPGNPAQRALTLRGWLLADLDPQAWLLNLGEQGQGPLPLALLTLDAPAQRFWGAPLPSDVARRELQLAGLRLELQLGRRLALGLLQGHWVLLGLGGGMSLLFALAMTRLRARREQLQARNLREAEGLERLARVAEHTRQAVLTLDREGRVEWANAALLELSGRRDFEVQGADAAELLGLPAGEPRTQLEQALREGRALRLELAVQDAEGRERWLDLELQPVQKADGAPSGMVLLGLDLSQRRQTEQRLAAALREHEDLLRTVREHAVVCVTDPQGRVVDVNEAFCQLSGHPRSELIGMAHAQLAGLRGAAFWEPIWRQLQAGKSWRGAIGNRRPDGGVYWVDAILAPFFDAGGAIERFVCIGFDITASKAAQAELQRERERLNAIIEGTQAGTWEWNYQSGEWLVNPRFAELLGETPRTLQPWNQAAWLERVHPDDQERAREALLQHLGGSAPAYQLELRLRHAQGRWIWAQLRGTVVGRTPKGQPLWLAGTLFDVSERRQHEEQTRVRQQVLDRTERIGQIGGFELNLAENRLTWSDQVFRIHGLSPGPTPSLDQALRYFFEEDQERLKLAMSRAVQEAKGWDLELCLIDALGRFVWVRSVGEAEFDEQDGPLRIVGAYQDITQRRELEQAAQRQRDLMQTVIENLPCGLSVFDGELRLQAYNLELQRLLDMPPELLEPGRTRLQDLLAFNAERGEYGAGDLARQAMGELEARALAAAPHHFERTRPNGVTLDVRGSPMPGGGLVTTYIDISESKRAQELMRAQEHFLRLVADSVPGRIAYWTRERRCVFVNRSYAAWCGWEPERMLGATLEDVFGPERVASQEERLQQVLAGQLLQFERAEPLETGGERTMLVHYVPDTQAGEVRGFVVMALDISELKAEQRRAEALNDELAVERDRANAASIAKSQFLANMSHEIRTPMNAILGMLKLLRHTPLQPRQLDYAAKAEGAARSLLGLLNDILDFSKVEAGKMVLDPQPFAVDELLRNLAVILASNVGAKPVELILYVDPRVPAHLVGDALRLQQVLINLGGNAVKFTERGDVVISLRRLSERVERGTGRVRLEFSVRDTGIGIAEDKQQSIFGSFTQAEASTTRRFGGTGLGLAISQRLVQLMGGEIGFTSQTGRGSRFAFTLELPLAPQQEAAAHAGGLRLLVVDDNPVTCAALEAMAEGLGWQALYTATAADAQALWDTEQGEGRRFDVVALDCQLADRDAWDFACQLRNRARALGHTLPVLGLGSAQDRERLHPGPEVGGYDGFLVKPVTAGMLDEAVATVLGRVRPRRLQAQAADGASLAGLRLLLVEDNPNNQQVAQELLQAEGAEVVVADHGAQALDRLREQSFDLVLMDMQMPVMDGLAATRAIRQELGLGTLPIVAMTANALAADRLACLEAGMNEHVGKPFEMVPLVALIQRLVGVAAQGLAQPAGPAIDPTRLQQARAEGIDLQAAMERFMGRAGLYLRTCRSFARSARALPAQLRGHQGLPATERAEADRQALHGFKGLAATLAASTLAQWGATGEAQARAGEALDPAWIAALDQEIERGCTALLRHAQALADERSEPGKPAPAAQAEGPLKELRQLVQAQDLRALSVAAERRLELERFLGEELASLDEALASLDFERAKALLEAS